LESVSRLHDLQGGGLRRALLDLPCVFVGVAAIAWIGGWLALAPAALLAGAMLMLVASGADAADALQDGAAHDARSDDFFSECAAHVSVIRGAAMAPFFVRRMEQLQTSARDLQWRRIQAADRAEDLVTPLEAAMVLAVAAVGGVMALDGAVSLGALAASTLLALGVVRPVVALTAAVQRAANLWPQRVEEERLPDATTLRPATPSPAALEVDAVVAPGGARLRFSTPGGALIALTGGDGPTLSATLRVLAGIESPVDGAVFFRGVSIAACRAAHTGAVALVTPGSALLRGTILENLTLFGQGGAERDALAACDVLGLRPEIDRLPRGLETPVGEGAADALPGALAHRLCIARALALSPSLLLLDQPQARLDPAADRAMIAGLGALKGRMTVIVATNRPSYLALADRAFLVDGDRCREIAPDAPRAAARRAGRG
jgi:ABC-type bacteriocin/lantibiotic exporter with double-glycine peptidase domain